MRKIVSGMVTLALLAGTWFATPVAAEYVYDGDNKYPKVFRLTPKTGGAFVDGVRFFKGGESFDIYIEFNVDNSACNYQSAIGAQIVPPGQSSGPSYGFVIQEDTNANSTDQYDPVFPFPITGAMPSGKLVFTSGPNLCGTGDYFWSNGGTTFTPEFPFPDGIASTAYFKLLFERQHTVYIDNTSPTVGLSESSNATYKKTHNVTINASDAPVDNYIQLSYVWTTSASAPAAGAYVNGSPEGAALAAQPTGTGNYYLHVKATDVVGHTSNASAGPFAFDHTAPTVTMNRETLPAAQSHTVTYSPADVGGGVATVKYQWFLNGSPHTAETTAGAGSDTLAVPDTADGSYTLKLTATDTAGNTTTVEKGPYVIDQTPPTATFSPAPSATPVKGQPVDVTLTDATGTLGQAHYLWSASASDPAPDAAGWTPLFDGTGEKKVHTAQAPSPDDANGSYYLHVKTEDSAGNVDIVHATDAYMFDNTLPDVSFSLPSQTEYAQSLTTSLTISDSPSSEIGAFDISYLATTQDTADGTEPDWKPSTDGTFTLSALSGIYYIHAKVRDQAGNETQVRGGPYRLDNTKPTGSLSAAAAHTRSRNATLTLGASDDTDRPMEMALSLDGGQTWSAWEPFNPSKTIALGEAEGVYNVQAKFRDEAGNESDAYPLELVYDATPPQPGEIVYSRTTWTNQPVVATLKATDNFTSASEIDVLDAPGFDHEFLDNGVYTFRFRDKAGNESAATAEVDWIDKTLPTITFAPDGLPGKHRSVTASVYATDNITSSASLTYDVAWSQDASAEPTAWEPLGPDFAAAKSDGDGLWYLWARATDEAGNVRTARTQPFQLDNTAPVGAFLYNPTGRTAGNVTATLTVNEPVTITKPAAGEDQHIFTENGEALFEFVDEAGNVGTALAQVIDKIDRNLPTAKATLTPNGWTNGTVRVTVDASAKPSLLSDLVPIPGAAPVTQDDDTAVFDFETNGSLRYKITDLETQLENEEEILIAQIDKIAPIATLVYSTTAQTNEDVTVTLIAADDRTSVTILGDGKSAHTFSENGVGHDFVFADLAGNVTTVTAAVYNIDREAPNAVITYDHPTWTRNDVTATISFTNEAYPVTILNNGGSASYTFTEEGAQSFEFSFRDAAGNEGTAIASVDWIDRTAPAGTVRYSEAGWTNEDVTATLAIDDASGTAYIANNGGSGETMFEENGSFTFIVRDAAGNESQIAAKTERIDKTAPVASATYSANGPTRSNVRASVVADEPVTVVDGAGNPIETYYDFSANGTHLFRVRDRAGNETTVPAMVDFIDRTPPTLTVTYSTTALTKGDVIATVHANEEQFYVLNNNRSKDYVFKANGTFTFLAQDAAGNAAEVVATVANIDKSTAKATLQYSTTNPTTDNVTVIIAADRELTYAGGTNTITFTENGIRWVEATDALNNKYAFRVEVTNIDREKPKLTFQTGETYILLAGTTPNPKADLLAVDNLDGDMTAQTTVEHAIRPQTPGEYTVTYRAVDRAGNEAIVTRKALVVAPAQLAAYVNSSLAGSGDLIVYGDAIRLQLFGALGDATVKWLPGIRTKGEFKTTRNVVEDGVLPLSNYGYYTLLIQDQERQTRLVRVYILPATESVR